MAQFNLSRCKQMPINLYRYRKHRKFAHLALSMNVLLIQLHYCRLQKTAQVNIIEEVQEELEELHVQEELEEQQRQEEENVLEDVEDEYDSPGTTCMV